MIAECRGLAKSVVISEKPPDLPLFLRARAEKDRMRSGDGRVVGSIIGVLLLAFCYFTHSAFRVELISGRILKIAGRCIEYVSTILLQAIPKPCNHTGVWSNDVTCELATTVEETSTGKVI